MVSQRVLCRALVGRGAELEHLAAARRAASGSHGSAIMLLGEPGIGKSRLVREFQERFCARVPATVVQCRQFGQAAFDPLVDALARLDTGAPRTFRDAASKDEQIGAIVSAFERATAHRITTLIVEDAHWAQPELVQMLASLARWSANRRLLLIVTARDADVASSSPLFVALAQLARESTIVRLEPLAAHELSQLMEDALAGMGASVPESALADVRRRSAGNPLFAEELLRHAVDAQRGAHDTPAHAVPLSLQGVIRERLNRCGARDREILSAASAFGQRFRVDVLAQVFALEHGALVDALGRLVELQLVEPTADPLAYEFRHALARDVVYGDLLPADAHAFHLRIGAAVEAIPDREPYAELLAHSFWEAGQPARAAPHCERAGERAMSSFAYEDAAAWFERAASGFDRPHDVGRMLWRASVALNRLNDQQRAASLYERAIAKLVEAGDLDAAVRTSTYLAATLYNDGRETESVAQFAKAAALAARSGSTELQQHARIRVLLLHAVKHDAEAAAALCEEVDRFPLDEASRDAFEYFLARADIHALRGELAQRAEAISAVFASLARRGSPPNEARYAHACLANEALAFCMLDEARRHALAGLEIARGMKSEAPYMQALLAEIEERAGNLRAARAHLDAIPPGAELMHDFERLVATIRLGLATGDDALLATALERDDVLRRAERGGHANIVAHLTIDVAAALARLGRDAEAVALARRFVETLRRPYPLFWEIVEAARLVPSEAPALRQLLAADATAATPAGGATLALLDALIARGGGDDDACAAHAADAAQRFAALGWPLREALALELAGDRSGAVAIYRRIGAAADLRRLERGAPGDEAAVLSPQERALARLVAHGKNNREAADALCVSVKAVEKYLTSIYRKLGISSRTQLAGVVLSERRDLTPR
ncbi:MAG TPA: AAA family ATPase [Candidatus Baltobacteraceae bacterium]|nr:AAA family ATPase [Candidatus Baltobacteraceae bacterium]